MRLVGAEQLVGQVVGGRGRTRPARRRRPGGAPASPPRGRAWRTPPRPTWSAAPGRPARRRARRCASPCRSAAPRTTRCRPTPRRAPPRPRGTPARPARRRETRPPPTAPGAPASPRGPATPGPRPTPRPGGPARRRRGGRSCGPAAPAPPSACVPRRSCTTPMSCQPARSSRTPRSAPMPAAGPRRAGPAGAPAHDDRQPLVAGAARHRHGGQRAVEDEDADGRRHARRVGLPAQHQHAEHEPDGHGDDLPGPPARQRAAPLAGTEPVARPALPRSLRRPPAPARWPGRRQPLDAGPCPSSPM